MATAYAYFVSYYRVAHEWLKQNKRAVNITDSQYVGNAEVLLSGPISSWDDVMSIEHAIELYEVDASEEMLEFNNFHVKVISFALLGERNVEIKPDAPFGVQVIIAAA